MPYTVWSKGRLIGESELDYISNTDTRMMGDFFAAEEGERLMPVITGVRRALIELGRARRTAVAPDGPGAPAVRESEEYADVAEATAHLGGLELELRDPTGRVVPTQWIDITDTEYTLSLASDFELEMESESAELDAETLAEIEHDAAIIEEHFAAIERDGPPPDFAQESVFPRYQLHVQL